MLFTGDHLMQGSTVVIDPPDGDMAVYLDSLRMLPERLPEMEWLAPGHGFLLDQPCSAIRQLLQHRDRREAAAGKLEDEPQKDAWRRPVQRQAGRIVDLDTPAAQLGRNPPGKFAIGGDEGGGGARRLKLATEQQRDRHRLLLRADAVKACEPVERIRRLRRQPAPSVRSTRRAQRFADQANPPSAGTLSRQGWVGEGSVGGCYSGEQREV